MSENKMDVEKHNLRMTLESLIRHNLSKNINVEHEYWIGYLLLEIDDKLDKIVKILEAKK